jgi:DNA-binding beta-propeller fold protein YncE
MPKARTIVPLLLLVLSCVLCGFGAKLRQVAMIDLPGDPGFNQVAIANGQVVISRPATNTVEIFSPAKRRMIARISQINDPRGIAVDDKGLRVFIAMGGSSRIASVNSRNWQVEKLIPVSHRPEKLLWVAETRTLYAASSLDRTLSIVDPAGAGRETSVKDIDLDGIPEDLAYDPARHAVLITLQDLSQVVAIDRNGQIAGRFKIAASEPTGMALDNARRRLYVAVRYAVVALNADSGEELARIPAPGGTSTLALDADSNMLYAAAGDGSVLAIDLGKNTVDHELPTDVKGYGLAYDPARKMLFMPGGREGRSKMVVLTPISLNEPAPAVKTAQTGGKLEQTAQK